MNALSDDRAFGFVGLGDMGLPMARRILASGRKLIAWNRSPEKLKQLGREGAIIAATPAEVGSKATLIGLCLASEMAVEEVVFGSEGVLSQSPPIPARRWIADFSTGSPSMARKFSQRAWCTDVGWVDAPVSGGVPAATKGTLTVFVGGNLADLEALHPLLDILAARTTHMGPSGAGQAAKLCNQMIVSSNLMVIAETFAVARRAGVDVNRLTDALRGGFADSAPLQIFGPRMAGHQFTPRLGSIGLMRKDVGLIRDLASESGGNTPLSALCASLYEAIAGSQAISFDDDLSKLIGLFEPLEDESIGSPA
jgi:3-hydroxyisobutyrate dehydrogenase-like beta-hydroxyacid dehydrogenase